MFIKKAIATVMCGSLCLISSAQPAFAAETELYDPVQIDIQPQWINVSNITLSMSLLGQLGELGRSGMGEQQYGEH